ncbi:methylaspartate mutase [Streptomyces sp. NPDC047000]|uniref:methylaspartate mutase n=1 Tax=Streptomyces sp. NPDC047000 TaxID=3155474 RepID=UPI0033C5C80D
MGMQDPLQMRAGLLATKRAAATTVGTITLDSYTRTGDFAEAHRSVAAGLELNGYPLVSLGPDVTRRVLRGVADPSFPVQVRHGSADPERIFTALAQTGLAATEGGPVSYCLPYSRTPLRTAVGAWRRCCRMLAERREQGVEPHLETFGGCLMGQLCPPGLLVAMSVLEGMFFREQGLRSISLSYTQQANSRQDEEAVAALRRIASELLPDVEWHVVVYAYMGVFPRTPAGARLLLEDAARLCVRTGAARLIVKTTAEAYRIPTIAENVRALEQAAAAAAGAGCRLPEATVPDTGIEAEARALIDAVLDLRTDLGDALVDAFHKGYLDIPYCLHPDNGGRSRGRLDQDGRLHWSAVGSMPVPASAVDRHADPGSAELLAALSFVRRTYDRRAAATLKHSPTGEGHQGGTQL